MQVFTTPIASLTPAPNIGVREGLIGRLIGADFNSAADQAIPILGAARYIIRRITVVNASINLTTAAGGFYRAAGKVNAVVNSGTIYTALVAPANYFDPAMTAAAQVLSFTEQTLFLLLTTPQGAAATADVYIFGDVLA